VSVKEIQISSQFHTQYKHSISTINSVNDVVAAVSGEAIEKSRDKIYIFFLNR